MKNGPLPLGVRGVNRISIIGVTICHDCYLGLLQAYLGRRGAQIWVNPTGDNVVHEKWSSILRLRAVENRFTALCTLHCNPKKPRTHPFGLSPDGQELYARHPGEAGPGRVLSECTERGIYLVDVPIITARAHVQTSLLPICEKKPTERPSKSGRVIRVSIKNGTPKAWNGHRWVPLAASKSTTINHNPIMLGLIKGQELFDLRPFFKLLLRADQEGCHPFFWNVWDNLPCKPDQLVSILLGRSLEFCAPVILSDLNRIYEATEIASRRKILRRIAVTHGSETSLDLSRAWGLKSSFKMVTQNLRGEDTRKLALNRYASLIR